MKGADRCLPHSHPALLHVNAPQIPTCLVPDQNYLLPNDIHRQRPLQKEGADSIDSRCMDITICGLHHRNKHQLFRSVMGCSPAHKRPAGRDRRHGQSTAGVMHRFFRLLTAQCTILRILGGFTTTEGGRLRFRQVDEWCHTSGCKEKAQQISDAAQANKACSLPSK